MEGCVGLLHSDTWTGVWCPARCTDLATLTSDEHQQSSRIPGKQHRCHRVKRRQVEWGSPQQPLHLAVEWTVARTRVVSGIFQVLPLSQAKSQPEGFSASSPLEIPPAACFPRPLPPQRPVPGLGPDLWPLGWLTAALSSRSSSFRFPHPPLCPILLPSSHCP